MRAYINIQVSYKIPDDPDRRREAYGTADPDECAEIDREQFITEPADMFHILDVGDDLEIEVVIPPQ